MSQTISHPRLLVAGTGGDSGKTLVTLALVRALVRDAVPVQAFKKGPDYIDAAWLGWASGREARHLDTWMMGEEACLRSFRSHAPADGISIVEGNRGLYDGMDARGTHSSATLARLLQAPVLLVLPVRKVTATAAAVVAGMAALDLSVRIAGVVLNHVSGARHERVVREAVQERTGIPVLGAIPAFRDADLLPERHLGLVPLHETGDTTRLEASLDDVASRLDLAAIRAVARGAGPLPSPASGGDVLSHPAGPRVRIGVFRDAAFSFYYPENLEALSEAGADLVLLSPLTDEVLPPLDALVLGGGFPETHAERLAANAAMRSAVRAAAEAGLPMYAECGGLMYLSRSIAWRGRTWPMCGVLPVDIEVCATPQGHGYAEVTVDRPNPFFPEGTRLRGHEFHYSRISAGDLGMDTAFAVTRGRGAWPGRDGLAWRNVLATWVHVHATGTPQWAIGVVRAARTRRAGG